MISEFFGDALRITAWIAVAILASFLAFTGVIAIVSHIDDLIGLARQVPAKTAIFFGFMGFFLWTTVCSQCVINATTKREKQVWAIMLYIAVWTLLVIHLQSQGMHL